MNSLNLKAVCRVTGLSADRIRSWEKRYKAVSPKRNNTGVRVYQPHEVERLKMLASLVSSGFSIGSIANLADESLISLTFKNRVTGKTSVAFQQEVVEVIEKLKNFQIEEIENSLKRLFFDISPRDFVLHLFPQAMVQLGLEYERGKISVAQEHALSRLFESFLSRIDQNLPSVHETGMRVLLAAPDGEKHEFALQILSILCKSKGFRVHNLGAVPLESLYDACEKLKPNALLISIPWLASTEPAFSVTKYIKSIDKCVEKSCDIWVGGAQINLPAQSRIRKNLWIFESILEFENKIFEPPTLSEVR